MKIRFSSESVELYGLNIARKKRTGQLRKALIRKRRTPAALNRVRKKRTVQFYFVKKLLNCDLRNKLK